MNNLQQPAFPISEKDYNRFADSRGPWTGFTKLEYAAILIAQGLSAKYGNADFVISESVKIAKAVIEECNK